MSNRFEAPVLGVDSETGKFYAHVGDEVVPAEIGDMYYVSAKDGVFGGGVVRYDSEGRPTLVIFDEEVG